ncbi:MULTISPECIES: choice-of-anchor A family protein [Microbacterium]|uniref:choice-of-anchor A family protein n=1 Tax=Microbacterium TaxID=33882 RepID=UPI00146EB792|nr:MULTISPECIES: choice-of-anchor A family protein [Microbacterium]
MTRRKARRKTVALAAAMGLILGGGLVALPPSVEPAAAAIGECPEGTIPGPGNTNPVWTDQNVAVYAGGDFQVRGAAAEAEGLVVVQGDASFDKAAGGRFNVGWVGVGSGVTPLPGTTMLAVGGDVSVGASTVLDVGANAFDNGQLRGGDVQVGGVTIPDYEATGANYELNNGTLTQGLGAAAVAPWSSWGTLLADESADFAAATPTGTVTAGALLTFTGDDSSPTQVFEVAAATLAANPALGFAGIPDGASVVVNVTGGPVTWAPNYFAEDGVRADDPASPLFGVLAARTLWNFVDATSVHIAGSSQVLGTVLVPGASGDPTQPTLRVTASTNGRLYTNGTLLMDGVGNEHHNYPWVDAPFDCIPVTAPVEVGSITIEKILSADDQALLPPGTTFHGLVTCTPADGGELVVEWEVAPGETTTVDGLPVGAPCEATETLGSTYRVRLLSAGQSLDPTALAAWQTPVWTVNGEAATAPVAFTVPSPSDETQLAFAVENALAVGSFTIRKVVSNPDEVPFADGFSGSWQCAATQGGAGVIDSGTWALDAGEVSAPIEAPVGAWCTVTETLPAAPVGGSWSVPVVSPAEVQITAESAQTPLSVTVSNTLTQLIGAFTITKTVTGADAPAIGFEGTWGCVSDGETVAEGLWELAAGETSDPFAAPVGSTCTIDEIAPTAAGGSWAAPQISPASTVITAESAQTPLAFEVVNAFTADLGPDDGGDGEIAGELPATGSTIPWWAVGMGAALVAAGAVMLALTVVRRRRP